jgi:hypothetical protein
LGEKIVVIGKEEIKMSRYVITYTMYNKKLIFGNTIYKTKEDAKKDLVKFFWKQGKPIVRKYGRIKKIL